MVGMNPVLGCLIAVEESVSRGDAVRDAVLAWLSADRCGCQEFRLEVMDFLRRSEHFEDENAVECSESRCRTLFRQTLFSIFSDGLAGGAILPRLRELRLEIEAQLELDIKAHVEGLPLKMLVPLLLFMFPAFLILLLGPITRNFVEALR